MISANLLFKDLPGLLATQESSHISKPIRILSITNTRSPAFTLLPAKSTSITERCCHGENQRGS